MKQQCKYCHNEFDIEDFSPCAIRRIMETERVCFTCAFWKWQKEMDSCRPWKDGILPIITQEFHKVEGFCNKQNHPCLIPSNRQNHYCLTLGSNNLIRTESDIKEIFRNITTGILTIEGHLFPYTDYSKQGGITYQGEIPENNKDFYTNAIFIQGSELEELLSRADLYTKQVIYGPSEIRMITNWKIVTVPESIIKRKFNLDW